MIDTHWPVQDAKQRFSELVRRAESDGPQFITRHGAEVAVILDIDEYRQLAEPRMSFVEFLRSVPKSDAFVEIMEQVERERAEDIPRPLDLAD